VTQRWPWIRFVLPGNVGDYKQLEFTSGLAKPNALLEQIWNTC
jgi:hypothetical protein